MVSLRGRGPKQSRRIKKGIATLALSSLAMTLLILVTPLPALGQEEIKLHCFKADECAASPYFGTLSELAPECKDDAKAASEGRFYYCYAPPPKVCQPGSTDTNCAVKLQVSIGGKEISGLEGYISALYQYLIAISGILAGIMIVWAGVKWLMSAGNAEMISDAKHKIGGAIIGLVLVVMSYVLLQTINPALVTLKLPPIKLSRRLEAMSGGFCTVQSGIKCGEPFDCSTNPELCGGTATGNCSGQICGDPTNETCTQVIASKILDPGGDVGYGTPSDWINPKYSVGDFKGASHVCISKTEKSECQNCQSFDYKYKNLKYSKTFRLHKCASTACPCLVTYEKGANMSCTSAQAPGGSCNIDAECGAGLICNTQWGNTCKPPGEKDEKCANDHDCNLSKGLHCNTAWGNTCQPPLSAGDKCATNIDCQSGDCDLSFYTLFGNGCCRDKKDGECP